MFERCPSIPTGGDQDKLQWWAVRQLPIGMNLPSIITWMNHSPKPL